MRENRRRIATTLAVLPLLIASAVVGASELGQKSAAASHDPRCDDDVVMVDQESETTLTPVGTRIVITRASCSTADRSETGSEVRVTANPTGVEEYVVAVLKYAHFERSGPSDNIRRLELHAPAPPSAAICVEIDGEKTCVPPQ
ncbi:hypothetical protein [Haloechinothrix salitolerans]|uniref:Secreted protein n=1 Tax=Haloechinothrix salitolerans TaxID=926830 RepID=A0ABW2BZY6_9PSEU